MLVRLAAFASVMASAMAAIGTQEFKPPVVKADSSAGQALMKTARRVEQYGDQEFEWVANYEIQYVGCHETTQFAGEEQRNEGGALYTQRLVHFYLCPAGTWSSKGFCEKGGEYIVDMREFVDAFTEARMEEEERICENIRENCYCNNYNDDQACENSCFRREGAEYCVEDQYQEEFEIQRYIECAEMENQNGNNNNNIQFFIGPYCASDDFKILLGVFSDETCTTPVSDGLEMYSNGNYGQELPYSDESIVDNKIMSCQQVDENQNQYNNNYNQYQEKEVTEMCAQMYEFAGKCETNLEEQYYYFQANEKACEFIHKTLPLLESASHGKSGNGALIAFLVIFALLALGLGYYAWTLHKKLERSSVDLSAQDGGSDKYATMT